MLRQAFVEEGVAAVEDFQKAPVVADDVLEEHLGLAPHGLTQLAGQFEFAEPAEGAREGGAGLLQFLLLGGGEVLRRLAIERPEPRPTPIRLGVKRLIASDHGPSVDEHRINVARLEPLADKVAEELR